MFNEDEAYEIDEYLSEEDANPELQAIVNMLNRMDTESFMTKANVIQEFAAQIRSGEDIEFACNITLYNLGI